MEHTMDGTAQLPGRASAPLTDRTPALQPAATLPSIHLQTAERTAAQLKAPPGTVEPGHWRNPLWRPSCNFCAERRQGQITPSFMILHYTELNFQDSLDILTLPLTAVTAKWQDAGRPLVDGLQEVSAHYLVREDGKCFHLVHDLHRAWHAGISEWTDARGRYFNGMNDYSIGIEIVNSGDPSHAYPASQMEALAGLCWRKMREYQIPIENILGHDQIAPGRKNDPGVHFPWEWLRECLHVLQKPDAAPGDSL